MNRTTILLASLALSSCTTTEIGSGIRKASELSVEGCRGYLAMYPSATGGVGEICRKVIAGQIANIWVEAVKPPSAEPSSL